MIVPHVALHRIHQYSRPSCSAAFPAPSPGVVPGASFGVRLAALASGLDDAGLSLGATKTLFAEHLGLEVSRRAVESRLHAVSDALRPAVDRVWEEVRSAAVVHAGETRADRDGMNGWAWVLATADTVCYRLSRSRAAAVIDRLLPRRDGMIVVCDGYAVYAQYTVRRCWAHFTREAGCAAFHGGPAAEALRGRMTAAFSHVGDLSEHGGGVPEGRIAGAECELLALADAYAGEDSRACRELAGKIRNAAPDLLTCLRHPGVPLANNHAERLVRRVRRFYGARCCVRTREGADRLARSLSFYGTMRLRKRNPAAEMVAILGGAA